jgi:hypothetical protein
LFSQLFVLSDFALLSDKIKVKEKKKKKKKGQQEEEVSLSDNTLCDLNSFVDFKYTTDHLGRLMYQFILHKCTVSF